MKVAILHNCFMAWGGGEKVAVDLARIFKAPIFTCFNLIGDIDDVEVIEIGKYIKIPIFDRISQSLFFSGLNLDEYGDFDVVISSGEYAKYYVARQWQKHIHYCHTPIRAMYDLRNMTKFRRSIFLKLKPIATFFHYVCHPFEASNYYHLDKVVANSKNVKERLYKYFKVEAEVVYPAIDVSKFKIKESEDYYLSVQRIFPEKCVDFQISIFNRLGLPLKIVGEGRKELHEKLESMANSNIEFLGWVDEKELLDLYSHCKGFIATAMNEDFGLTPLEAMASGKPVFAVNEGGYRESVINGVTGLLLKRNIHDFVKGILAFESGDWSPAQPKHIRDYIKNKFDISIFEKKMREIVLH